MALVEKLQTTLNKVMAEASKYLIPAPGHQLGAPISIHFSHVNVSLCMRRMSALCTMKRLYHALSTCLIQSWLLMLFLLTLTPGLHQFLRSLSAAGRATFALLAVPLSNPRSRKYSYSPPPDATRQSGSMSFEPRYIVPYCSMV